MRAGRRIYTSPVNKAKYGRLRRLKKKEKTKGK
jgi:hypothetical protein